jgi:NADH dehydrogenase
MKTILVIGATGNLGKAVAKQLKKDGFKVRVLSRDKEKARKIFNKEFEFAEGDVLQPETIETALDKCHGVYINLSGDIIATGVKNIVELASKKKIEQIGFISGCTVREQNAWHPMIKNNFLAEEAIKASGIAYSIFKPTFFMDTLPRFIMKGKVSLFGKQPNKYHWIYSGDLGEMVSKAFQLEAARNKSFTVYGPEPYTMDEAILKFCEFHHPMIKEVKHVPFWVANILAFFMNKPGFKFFISIMKYFETHAEEGDPKEANEMLGKPHTTVVDFSTSYRE